MQKNNTKSGFFGLIHICEALNKLNDERLQILSRILLSRLDDLKSVMDRLKTLSENILSVGDSRNPYMTITETVSIEQKRSSMEKKKISLLKDRRSLENQIVEMVKTIHKAILKQKHLHGSATDNLVAEKLREVQAELLS